MAEGTGPALARLAAGTPRLVIAMAGPGGAGGAAALAGEATVIDVADPCHVPVTVSPFEPAPGYPVQAHADRLAGLFEAAFGPAEPAAAALRAGLGQAYAECGWDPVTGSAAPGAAAPPAVPSFRQFRRAVLAAAEELGYTAPMRADVRAFLRAGLDPVWAGPAGLFLEGGHRADVDRLLRGNALVVNGGVTDGRGVSFLTGVLLTRLAEQLRPRAGTGCPGRHLDGHRPDGQGGPGGDGPLPRLAVVIAGPDGYPGLPSGWFGRLVGDIRAQGADVIVAPQAGGTPGRKQASRPGPGPAPGPAARRPAAPAGAAPAAMAGRRSAACGERCQRRPCTGHEVHAARLLARDEDQAWLRLWVQTLVLAFLTGRPTPRVPDRLGSDWRALGPRLRECLLATVVDGAVTPRAAALRQCYDPRSLASVVGAVATGILDAPDPAPFRAGLVWVIPQLRWLHEMERVSPLGPGRLSPDDIAPPLDFALAGLPDWPGIRVRDRIGGLRRHRLSAECERNRKPATIALLGEDGRASLDADLAAVAIGVSPPLRLRHAAQMMGTVPREAEPGWLEAVLSWPARIAGPHGSPGPPGMPRRNRIASGRYEH